LFPTTSKKIILNAVANFSLFTIHFSLIQMYAQQSLQDTLFLMLYGAVAILALVSGLYLWLRRSNAIAPGVTPPMALHRWTAAFFVTAALSHVWWYVLGVYWLTDDRLVRNIVAVTLDHITLVPLVMALLLRMLQDRQRPLWPWFLTQVPTFVAAAVGIVRHDEFYGFDLTTYWQISVMTLFVLYYIHALIQPSKASPTMPISTACVSSISCGCIGKVFVQTFLSPPQNLPSRADSAATAPSQPPSSSSTARPSRPG
jgi:hypothetical protein